MTPKSEPSKNRPSTQLFDVARPGKSSPATSSRPIIVSHRPIVQDPMVNDSPKETPLSPPKTNLHQKVMDKLAHATSRLSIMPAAIDPADMPKPGEIISHQTKKVEPATPVPAPEKEIPNLPVVDETPEPSTKDTSVPTPAAEPPDVEEPTSPNQLKRQGEIKSQQQADRQAKLDKLITDKTYFVPVGQARRKRNTRRGIVIIGTLLLIALLGFNFVLDAGFIKGPIRPLTNLIKN